MSRPESYLFTSERLGFRLWLPSDLEPMAAINGDEKVMQYFESTISKTNTEAFMNRMNREFEKSRHCYFAVDLLDNKELIGCIGMSLKDFVSDFTPCVDIGWRLGVKFWGKGYATEGAKRCLQYASDVLDLKQVIAITPVINKPSVHVMDKLGMTKHSIFIHPKLDAKGPLNPCVAFEIDLSN